MFAKITQLIDRQSVHDCLTWLTDVSVTALEGHANVSNERAIFAIVLDVVS